MTNLKNVFSYLFLFCNCKQVTRRWSVFLFRLNCLLLSGNKKGWDSSIWK